MLPLARAILTFYREHYPRRDEDGKMLFEPGQAIETWQIAANPMPEVAGLHWVTGNLLCLPGITDTDRKAWTELRDLLPPLPTRTEAGKQFLLPARRYDARKNNEIPELYAVFPYRHFGVGGRR